MERQGHRHWAYRTKLAFLSQSLELSVLADRTDPLTPVSFPFVVSGIYTLLVNGGILFFLCFMFYIECHFVDYPRIRSTRSFVWAFLCTFSEFEVLDRCLAFWVSTTVYGISLSWSSVIPAVSTKSNCKCFANSLDQMRGRPSDGDLDAELFQITIKFNLKPIE